MKGKRNGIGPIAINTQVEILAESSDWLVVNKPAPLLVHPTNETGERTLWHILNDLLPYELVNGGQISLVNRLDRETSGLTLVAKTFHAARVLGKAMQAKLIRKEYLALVYGHPEWDEKEVTLPILRRGEVEPSRIWVRQMVHEQGKDCRTDFKVIGRYIVKGREVALIRCAPITGRMHQIRVHLSHIGFPIIGDKIYGPSEDCYLQHIETGWTKELEEQLWLPRQALHAWILEFPYEDELVRVVSPLPEDWKRFFEAQ